MSAPLPPEPDRDILESSSRWGRAASLLERVPRWLALAVAALLLAGGGTVLALGHIGHAATGHPGPSARAVSFPAACGPFVDWTSSRAASSLRIVLGDVAVAPAYLPPAQRLRLPRPPIADRPWRYGWKTAFAYRGGRPPVTISVPAGWQQQISLFGTAGPASGIRGTAPRTLHIPRCPPRGAWDTFVWIFYLSTPTACAPLQVRTQGRAATVWFGFGTRCRAGAGTGPGPVISGRSAARR